MAIVLKSVKVNWAKVQQPEDAFGKMLYSLDVVDLNDNQVAQLEKVGIKPKEKDGSLVLKCTKNAVNKEGKPMPKPVVLDGLKKPFEGIIGNGSICNVAIDPFKWEFAGKTGVKPTLVAVQVLELVEYGGKPEDLFEVESNDISEDTFAPDDDIPF